MTQQVADEPDHEIYLIYGHLWNRDYRIMVDPISIEDARRRYEDGGSITVACGVDPLASEGDSEVPDGLFQGDPVEHLSPAVWSMNISTRKPFAAVDFYDIWGTRVAAYDFLQLGSSGRMFLHQITKWRYPRENRYFGPEEAVDEDMSRFNPEGYHLSEHFYRNDEGADVVDTTEYRDYDTSAHWEDVPQFGEWRGLTRRNRFST